MIWQGRRYAVAGIERRWRTPEGPAFQVETELGIPFELHYRELEKAWAIQPLAAGDPDTLDPLDQDKGKQEDAPQSP